MIYHREASNDVGQEVAMDTNFGGMYSGVNSNAIEEVSTIMFCLVVSFLFLLI
jgi:hypothetical protein